MTRRVLVVDADGNARRGTVAALRYGGFATDTAGTVQEARRRLSRRRFVGIIVDPGHETAAAQLAHLRALTDAAIIVVAEPDDRDARIECLDAGADDYVVRPFDTEELLARLRAVLRRAVAVEEDLPLVTPDFVIHLADRRLVRADGCSAALSPTEWKLVEVLVHRAGHLVTREDILSAVWGPEAVTKTQYLRVHMASIRQKIEPDPARPRYFVTVPGLGIKFDPAPTAQSASG